MKRAVVSGLIVGLMLWPRPASTQSSAHLTPRPDIQEVEFLGATRPVGELQKRLARARRGDAQQACRTSHRGPAH